MMGGQTSKHPKPPTTQLMVHNRKHNRLNIIKNRGIYEYWFKAAAKCEYKELKSLLSKGLDPNYRRLRGPTQGIDSSKTKCALDFAAEAGEVECVKLLLENGADPLGLPDFVGRPCPLRESTKPGHFECVKLILNEALRQKPKQVMFALAGAMTTASYTGHVNILEYLLEIYDQVKIDKHELSLVYAAKEQSLKLAALDNQIECVRLLLKSGVSLQAIDNTASEIQTEKYKCIMNALCVASYKCNFEIVDLFLEGGINCNGQIIDNEEYLPLHSTIEDTPKTEYMYHSIIRENRTFDDRIENDKKKVRMIRKYIEHGADVRHRSRYVKYSLLELAVLRGYTEVTQVLLEAQKTTCQVKDLWQPLLAAGSLGWVEITKILLGVAAFPQMRQLDFDTFPSLRMIIWGMASHDISEEHLTIIKDLLKAGYDFEAINDPDLPCILDGWMTMKEFYNILMVFNLFEINIEDGLMMLPHGFTLKRSIPQSLKSIVRQTIRGTVRGITCGQKMQYLPLPTVLKNYLNYSDIE